MLTMQTNENIHLKIKLSGLKHCGGLNLLIADCLRALQASLHISTARVVFEQRWDAAPSETNSGSKAGDNVARWPANGIAALERLSNLVGQSVLTHSEARL